MNLIRKMIDHLWNMIFDFMIEEREYEGEISEETGEVELSPESFYTEEEFIQIETPLLLQDNEWDHF